MAPQSLPIVEAIFCGGPKTLHDERGPWQSSIQRERVIGEARVTMTGIVGDKATQPYHGGLDAALCVHLTDHYRFWSARYGVTLAPGAVGENLTLGGINEEDIFVGDVLRLGTVLAQVSGPRVPCANQARHLGRLNWVKLTVRENRTGFYLRVLKPGNIQAGDRWQLEERVNEDASIPRINRCMYLEFDPKYADRMLHLRGLGEWWRQQAAAKLRVGEEHWTSGMHHDPDNSGNPGAPPQSPRR